MDGIVNTITRKQAIDQGLPRYFTGKPVDQSVAIAYSVQRKAAAKPAKKGK